MDWQIETFCCMTTSPSPAPMMEPTRLPTVTGISHQPSSQARMPRRGPGVAEFLEPAGGAPRHGAERVADHVGGVVEDGKFLAPGEQRIHGLSYRQLKIDHQHQGVAGDADFLYGEILQFALYPGWMPGSSISFCVSAAMGYRKSRARLAAMDAQTRRM